jgi:DNA-binding GntR family transcriptional regulator
MGSLPEFKAVAMRDAIAAVLRRALLERRFAPGEAIVESALAAEMKVSRGPVREALLLLMQEGLVTHNQNRGFAVLDITESDRFAADQVRYHLETLALQLAREHIIPDDLATLERIKSRMCESYRSGDVIARLDDEIEFHGTLWRLSRNPYVLSCLQRVAVPDFTYGTAFRLGRPDLTLELFEAQHQLYIDYLARRTQRTAEECVRFHLGLIEPASDAAPAREAVAV